MSNKGTQQSKYPWTTHSACVALALILVLLVALWIVAALCLARFLHPNTTVIHIGAMNLNRHSALPDFGRTMLETWSVGPT